MAKMFYTWDEVKHKLRTRDDKVVKELIQDGILREFRDGEKIMVKRDELDKYLRERDEAKNKDILAANPEKEKLGECLLDLSKEKEEIGAQLLEEVDYENISGTEMIDRLDDKLRSRRILINEDGTTDGPYNPFGLPSPTPLKPEPVTQIQLTIETNSLLTEQNLLLQQLIKTILLGQGS